MAKFCHNCGNTLEDSAAFCDKCGTPCEQAAAAPQYEAPAAPRYEAPQYEAPQYEAPQYPAPQYGNTAVAVKENPMKKALDFVKAKKFFFIAGAAAVIVLIVLICIISSCASNNAKGAVNKAFNCAKNLDIKGYYDVDYSMNFDKERNKDEEMKKVDEQMKSYGAMLDTYKGLLKSAKINVKKDEKVSDDEFNSLKEDWSSKYRDTDKIKEIHKVEFEISGLPSMMGSSSSSSGDCYAVKVGGKWYVKDFTGVGSLGI